MSEINELLDITSTGRSNAPYRVLIYGPGGVGKSTFCSKAKDVYFLPTEEGVNDIHVPQYKEQIRSLDIVYRVLDKLLNARHPYKSVCLDSAGATESLIIEAIESRLKKSTNSKSPKSIQEMNDDFGSGYTAIANEWRDLLKKFDELRSKREINILLTAHSKREKVINLEGKDYDRFTLDLIGQKSSKVITNWCDHVLFARQDVSVSNESKHKILALSGALSIYTRGTAQWSAKTRGEITWPERIPLSWDVFSKLRELISTHGKNLPDYLKNRFEKIKPKISSEKKSNGIPININAETNFNTFINGGYWHLADTLCEQLEIDFK